jgi:U3 small nucleolar RNA-associated protein 22
LIPGFEAPLKYDYIVTVPIPDVHPAFYNPRVKLDFPCFDHFLTHAIPRLINRSLTTRVKLISWLSNVTTIAEWELDECPHRSPFSYPQLRQLSFGMILDSAECYRKVDMGPSPQDELAVRDFRRLWGSKSAMRRFPDGTIIEAVVWSSSNPLKEALNHVFQRQLKVKPFHWNQEFASKYLNKITRAASTGNANSKIQAIADSFQKLSNIISSLDKIPLPISAIYRASPELTRTAIYANRNPAQFVVELENSGKWPTEPEALYHMTALFLLRFAQELESTSTEQQVLKCSLLGSPISLDILFEGFLFRMVIKARGGKSLTPDLAHALDLSNLTLKFPEMALTIRIFKLFIAKHMLGYHLHDHLVELLVAHVYTCTSSYHTSFPSDAMTGFLRALELIVHHDWKQPLRVQTRVKGSKDRFAATHNPVGETNPLAPFDDQDVEMEEWIGNVPNVVCKGKAIVVSMHKQYDIELLTLKRIRALSKACLHYVNGTFNTGLPVVDLSKMMHAGLDYDVLIYLKGKAVNEYVLPGMSLCLRENSTDMDLLNGFSPFDMFIQSVRERYGDLLRIFYNDVDGQVIGLVFNPMELVPRRFGLNHRFNCRLLPGGGSSEIRLDSDVEVTQQGLLMQPNVESICEEISRLGEGLIDHITIKSVHLLPN